MTLLARALTCHPGTSPATLARIADQHPALAYAVLAHPNGPDNLPHDGSYAARDLHAVLHAPTTTPADRHRVLTHTRAHALNRYLTRYSDAHPDAINTSTRLHLRTPRAARAILAHPDVTPDMHLHAVRVCLDDLYGAEPRERDAIITHATRHGAHLAELAHHVTDPAHTLHASDPDMLGFTALATDLRRYADMHTAGTDPHQVRLTKLTTADLSPIEMIWRTVDPDIANTLLTAHPTAGVAAAILTTPELAHTDAAYRALHLVSARNLTYPQLVPHATLPPAHPGARYTRAQLLTTPGYQPPPRAVDGRLVELDDALTADPHATGPLADHLLTAWDTRRHRTGDTWNTTPTTSELGQCLTHLAIHPTLPPQRHTRVLDALHTLATHLPETDIRSDAVLAARITTDPDTLTSTPLPRLLTLAENTSTLPHLADRLARTLPTLDDATLATALTLEPDFTGTLDELLNTARAIAS